MIKKRASKYINKIAGSVSLHRIQRLYFAELLASTDQEEEDSPALKVARLHKYMDAMLVFKKRLITDASNNSNNLKNRTTIIRKQEKEE